MKQVIIMSIKLIAVDIDGTLLNSQRQVTPEVFQAIQDAKAAGVKVVIVSKSIDYFTILNSIIDISNYIIIISYKLVTWINVTPWSYCHIFCT